MQLWNIKNKGVMRKVKYVGNHIHIAYSNLTFGSIYDVLEYYPCYDDHNMDRVVILDDIGERLDLIVTDIFGNFILKDHTIEYRNDIINNILS